MTFALFRLRSGRRGTMRSVVRPIHVFDSHIRCMPAKHVTLIISRFSITVQIFSEHSCSMWDSNSVCILL